jgi:hypothetical protein
MLRVLFIHKGPKVIHGIFGQSGRRIFTSPSPARNTPVRLCFRMKDMIAHWNGFETVFINGSVLTVERRKLIQTVFHAADLTDWPKGQLGNVPIAVLRSVILYCLALNICSSEEIVETTETDPSAKYLCANHSLDWQRVHDFRKRTLPQIRDSLTQLFETLCSATAHGRTRALSRSEADQRLRRAAHADSIVLDL